ncbi:MAG: ATP-binding protein [Actinomycetota bacterium]|nr:ATP-binding protein [Actinomycetota bacterium]
MALVGRQAELAELDDLLQRAADGTGGLVVFVGPAGSGKTELLAAAVKAARARGFTVVGGSPCAGQPGRSVWAQILGELGAPAFVADGLIADAGRPDVDAAVRHVATGTNRLVVVDDIDQGGSMALEFLALVTGRLMLASVAVVATASAPLGIGRELRLRPLTEGEMTTVVGEGNEAVQHAVWVASGGLPGIARSLIAQLAGLEQDQDPLVELALNAQSTAQFLEIDGAYVRLLESAIDRETDDARLARLTSRLARELLGDTSTADRRRALIEDALTRARRAGDRQALSEALDARLHALWDPAAAGDRLAAAAEIIDLGRAAGDASQERHGLFWQFVALMELARVGEAESTLAVFQRSARTAGDADAIVMATSRHAVLALLRGRFDEATRLADEVAELGRRAGLADTDRLVLSVRGPVSIYQGNRASGEIALKALLAIAQRMPGHLYEAMVARVMVQLGHNEAAAVELDRVLPQALRGSGPRWLSAIADLAFVAAATEDLAAAAPLYEALLPYRGRLVLSGGANTVNGPVSHYLGLLATLLQTRDEAIQHFKEAIELEESIGALAWLADSLAGLADALSLGRDDRGLPEASDVRRRGQLLTQRLGMRSLLDQLGASADEWTLRRDGEDWLLEAGPEQTRLRDGLGLHHLRALLAAPRLEISALDLAAGGAGLVQPATAPVLDPTATAAYRDRLRTLAAELDAADEAGDPDRAARAEAERQGVLGELRRVTGLGGRPRRASDEAERARVNVTRNLRATLGRMETTAPRAAAHLQASVRTGLFCRYDPAPGGPTRWHV